MHATRNTRNNKGGGGGAQEHSIELGLGDIDFSLNGTMVSSPSAMQRLYDHVMLGVYRDQTASYSELYGTANMASLPTKIAKITT